MRRKAFGAEGAVKLRYLDTPKPRLFAHRGASGAFPENTMESFAAGLDGGAWMLELDVHGTRDGEVVVFHDATLERVTDGHGLVRDRTLAELRALDAGFGFVGADGGRPFRGRGVRIATLDEVLEAFPTAALNIEIKQLEPAIEWAVLARLDRQDARERVLLAAEDQRILDRIRAAAPDMLSGSSAEEVYRFHLSLADPGISYRPPGAALQVPPFYEGIEVVSAPFVERAHACGVEVHVWTINAPGEVERLLDLGVDGIMTDYPVMAAEVFARRGLI